MTHEASIDRERPSCLVFLLDRSYSMADTVEGSDRTLAQGVADAINRTLYELVLRCIADPQEGPRRYYDIGVIGYGASVTDDRQAVEPAFGGKLAGKGLVSIVDVANNPMRIEQRQSGGGRTEDAAVVRTPVWVDPGAGWGTPMCAAIELAGGYIAEWIDANPDSFPPLVVNITDGMVTDKGSDDAGLREWARRLRTLSTNDGGLVLLNLFLTATPAASMFFPSNRAGLPDPEGTMLFDISSELPTVIIDRAKQYGYDVKPGARGLVFNADIATLVRFLRIGTDVVKHVDA